MDGQGVGSCVMLGSAPSGPSFSISPSMKLSVAGHGGVGKGESCVLIPDLVVMEKVGASVGGILSSHYAAFPSREKWKNLNLDVSIVAPSACKVLGGVGSLGPVLLDKDASSSKRFLLAIARDSF
ncbi:hypothetical protein Tco_1250756 [Tanacetum coccineum]